MTCKVEKMIDFNSIKPGDQITVGFPNDFGDINSEETETVKKITVTESGTRLVETEILYLPSGASNYVILKHVPKEEVAELKPTHDIQKGDFVYHKRLGRYGRVYSESESKRTVAVDFGLTRETYPRHELEFVGRTVKDVPDLTCPFQVGELVTRNTVVYKVERIINLKNVWIQCVHNDTNFSEDVTNLKSLNLLVTKK